VLLTLLARRTLMLLRLGHENPLVAGNWNGCWRVRKTLVNRHTNLLNRLLTLKRGGCLIGTRLLSVLCRGNSLLVSCLAHKLATIHTTHICRLILATLLCVWLVLNSELNILTLNEVLVTVA
jgi:hypothetical protein